MDPMGDVKLTCCLFGKEQLFRRGVLRFKCLSCKRFLCFATMKKNTSGIVSAGIWMQKNISSSDVEEQTIGIYQVGPGSIL